MASQLIAVEFHFYECNFGLEQQISAAANKTARASYVQLHSWSFIKLSSWICTAECQRKKLT